MTPPALSPFCCRHCRRELAVTDGRRLFCGEAVALAERARLFCRACGAVTTWHPPPQKK